MKKSACSYELIESECVCEGIRYTGYGIRLNTEGFSSEVADISNDKEKVEELALLFNANELSELHFYDAIEDFIAEG
ncbi:MAG TPA: DUF6514 family protein [Bacillota bacterium]|nr:DUF6514 family protein [Bacillota bacterium]